MPRPIAIPFIEISQPVGTFYVGRLSYEDLIDISFIDIRSLSSERGLDSYLGIQRQLNTSRVKKISQYSNTVDATFPTSIILAIDERCVDIDYNEGLSGSGVLNIAEFFDPDDPSQSIEFDSIARVIDGQHRIEGLRQFTGERFDLNVSIFVGADIADQAAIFSTVNLTQTKVNRSLVFDLLELSELRTPEKTCHDVTVVLDSDEDSPLYHRVKRLGVATPGRDGETLSQATVVRALLRYLSSDPVADRDQNKRLGFIRSSAPDIDRKRLIFRHFYEQDKDELIVETIWSYFDAVRQRWPTAWDSIDKGDVLGRTNGFEALMRFLKPAFVSLSDDGAPVSTDQFLDLFNSIDIEDKDFTTDNYNPGTGGSSKLFRDFVQRSGLSPQQEQIQLDL